MENNRSIKYFTLATIMGMLIASPFFVLAYDDQTTHPALTDEIVDLFNLYYPKLKIDDADKDLIKKGSIDEDTDTRWMNHFYDPIYNRGLWGYSSSKVWALDTAGQALGDMGYVQGGGSVLGTVSTRPFDANTDYSWDRAIYDYVWADKKRGLQGLGHILHLLEDASVPDHTRNDPHPAVLDFGSPYEAWTARFTDTTIDGLALSLFNNSAKPYIFTIPQEFFYSLAKYSNGNFFSKDSIFDKEYDKPTKGRVLSENFKNGLPAKFVYNDTDSEDAFRLVYIKTDFVTEKNEYFIEDTDDLVLNDYWSHLSKQAVLHGAGMVRLFFEEADKERTSKMRLSRNKSLLDKISSSIGSVFGDSNNSSTPLVASLPLGAFDIATPILQVVGSGGPDEVILPIQPNTVLNIPTIFSASVSAVELQPEITSASVSLSISPGFGGGGSLGSSFAENTPSSTGEDLHTDTTIQAENIPEDDASSNTLAAFVDTDAPDVSLSVNACDVSLSSDACLIVASSFVAEWTSVAPDFDHFEVTCTFNNAPCEGFDFKNTTATSTEVASKDEGKYLLSARAFDQSDNASDVTAKEVIVSSKPIVINEVAWAGSAADSNDEWVELYNRTDQTILLDKWTLHAQTSMPYISLVGTIAPRSYYLMERGDDNSVSDIAADLIYGDEDSMWSFNNSSAPVILSYASTTIDEIPLCFRGAQWCGGGSAPRYLSMERMDPNVAGSSTTNWKSAMYEFIQNGHDANNNMLNATPKARNSANYLIGLNGLINFDTVLTKRGSPYLIDRNGLTLSENTTLSIEPGVVVKFVVPNEPAFYVRGTIKAVGTESEPIVFTSFYDDEYGGDTNNDGFCDKTNIDTKPACPFPGSWRRIHIFPSSAGSEFNHVVVRYGGRWFSDGSSPAMVTLESTDAVIRGSLFEYSYKYGLQMNQSSGVIEKSIFQNNNFDTGSSGLIVTGGGAVRNNTFVNNYVGLDLQSSAATVENNLFNNNKSYAVTVSGGLASLIGNSGSGNGEDGIKISGQLNATTSSFTMHANTLPYIIGSGVYEALEIPELSKVDVDAGVVFKSRFDGMLRVNGALAIHGDSKESVLFGSRSGDDGPSDWWRGISVADTGFLSGHGFTVRRAGLGCAWGTACAGILVNGGKIDIHNARLENNYAVGIRLSNSVGSTFSDVEFVNHNEPQVPTNDSLRSIGLSIINSDIGVGNLSFSNNALGVYSVNSTIVRLDSYKADFSANLVNAIPPDLF